MLKNILAYCLYTNTMLSSMLNLSRLTAKRPTRFKLGRTQTNPEPPYGRRETIFPKIIRRYLDYYVPLSYILHHNKTKNICYIIVSYNPICWRWTTQVSYIPIVFNAFQTPKL